MAANLYADLGFVPDAQADDADDHSDLGFVADQPGRAVEAAAPTRRLSLDQRMAQRGQLERSADALSSGAGDLERQIAAKARDAWMAATGGAIPGGMNEAQATLAWAQGRRIPELTGDIERLA